MVVANTLEIVPLPGKNFVFDARLSVPPAKFDDSAPTAPIDREEDEESKMACQAVSNGVEQDKTLEVVGRCGECGAAWDTPRPFDFCAVCKAFSFILFYYFTHLFPRLLTITIVCFIVCASVCEFVQAFTAVVVVSTFILPADLEQAFLTSQKIFKTVLSHPSPQHS